MLKHRFANFLTSLLATLLLGSSGGNVLASESHAPAPVILISIDGFRADYLERGKTPVLESLKEQGAYAKALRPSFPSLTFPNHYTLVTGLRPDHHGIVANTMDDPALPGVRFSMGNKAAVTDARWWNQAMPVWVSAEQQGVRTATMFWPGSEAAIHGIRPSLWQPFDGKRSAMNRVATLLGWLELPLSQRPGFLTLYFDDVDHAGHDFGPDSPQVDQSLTLVDEALASLISDLHQKKITANLIIVSDHGMAATAPERVIYLNQYLPLSAIDLITYGAVAGITMRPGQDVAQLNVLSQAHEAMQCWPARQIPKELEYGANPRVPEFTCLARPGWLILAEPKPGAKFMRGTHGYDHRSAEMAALFIANGPAFIPGAVIEHLDNVDVYPLLMRLLNLRAEVSHGQIKASQSLLKPVAEVSH